jgi:hypothetical protein
MSPLAGRFLGRDPIGYEDGMSLYENYFALNALDPNGLTKLPIPPNAGTYDCSTVSSSMRIKLHDFFPTSTFKGGLITVRGSLGIEFQIAHKTCKKKCCDVKNYTEVTGSGGANGRITATLGVDEEFNAGNWGFKVWGGVRFELHATGSIYGLYYNDECSGMVEGRLCWGIDFRATVRGGVESKIKYRNFEWDLAAAEIAGTCNLRIQGCSHWDGVQIHDPSKPTGGCEVYARVCGYGMCWRQQLL